MVLLLQNFGDSWSMQYGLKDDLGEADSIIFKDRNSLNNLGNGLYILCNQEKQPQDATNKIIRNAYAEHGIDCFTSKDSHESKVKLIL